MNGYMFPFAGFNEFDDEYSIPLADAIDTIKIRKKDITITEQAIIELAKKDIINLWTDYQGAGDALIAMAKGEKCPKINAIVMIRKKEVVRLLEYLGQSELSSSQQEPTPIKGKPETLQAWMKHVITVEKCLGLSDEMPDGLQTQLIKSAEMYGYRDSTAVKKAWSALGLRSVRNTAKMSKPPKTP